jgi:hypothetical protein
MFIFFHTSIDFYKGILIDELHAFEARLVCGGDFIEACNTVFSVSLLRNHLTSRIRYSVTGNASFTLHSHSNDGLA